MFFQRFYLGCLAHASYLIADERTKVAAVIDPQRDIDQYLEVAEQNGFDIRYVFLTHFHADFVAGHIELRDRLNAKIYLGERAQAEYDFHAVKDGDVVEFGDVRLSVLETPGHTPEGISILVYDLAQNEREPFGVLTGDTLFIGDVGRPDLLASIGVTADELSDMLYDSLNEKLLKLPDETKVYPAHGAGSMCGKNLSDATESTIGEQRRYNYALQPMSREEFRKIVTAEQPEAPEYFAHDAMLNRQDRQSLESAMQASLTPLPIERVVELQADGTLVVDVRDAAEFAGAHLADSINIGIDGKYATWCGTVLDKSKPIVVIAEDGREEEAIMRLGRIGFDHVEGYLKDGPMAFAAREDLIRMLKRITATALREQLDETSSATILDVRNEQEFEAGHIEGAVNIPLRNLNSRTNELNRDSEIVVHCAGGYRSSIAASLLAREGFTKVQDLVGGYGAWSKSTTCSAT